MNVAIRTKPRGRVVNVSDFFLVIHDLN